MLEKIKPDPERYGQRIPYLGGEPVPGTFLEMTYDLKEGRTGFAVFSGGGVRYMDRFPLEGNRLLAPYSANNNLIAHRVILFPSEAADYGSEDELIREIRAYIHRYVDLSPIFEKIATYYVLLTWVYDSFNELPYLRVRGDPGSGKTRFLLIVGSICYRPIFASGASTVSPLFRILDAFRGTLIIDEGDFRMSDEKAEIVKILNNGNARGFPVLRSEVTGNRKEFNPTAFNVFGPKLIGTRGFFEDRALESRLITEEMGHSKLREDIPINLPSSAQDEAQQIRNKLLMFRFRNRGNRQPDAALIDRSIEPRLNQIFMPLLSVIEDEAAKADIQNLAREYNRDMITDRGMETEAQVLEIIKEMADAQKIPISIKEITELFSGRHGAEQERPITAKWIGNIIRKKLHLSTLKVHGSFVIPDRELAKLELLFQRYGISDSATPPNP